MKGWSQKLYKTEMSVLDFENEFLLVSVEVNSIESMKHLYNISWYETSINKRQIQHYQRFRENS